MRQDIRTGAVIAMGIESPIRALFLWCVFDNLRNAAGLNAEQINLSYKPSICLLLCDVYFA